MDYREIAAIDERLTHIGMVFNADVSGPIYFAHPGEGILPIHKPSLIHCDYCGSVYKEFQTNCDNCGAPLSNA